MLLRRSTVPKSMNRLLWTHVRELASHPDRLIHNPKSLDAAQHYIESQIEQLELKPCIQRLKVGSNTTSNVFCRVGAADQPAVILGAHYDGIGEGANDNASGVSVALEVLRRIKQQPNPAPLVVAFFTGEESGLIGSHEFAANLNELGIQPTSMLNLDMLGDGDHKRIDLRIARRAQGLAESVKQAQGRDARWPLEVRIHRDVGCASDDYSFARYGVPAAMLIASYRDCSAGTNRCARHTTRDTVEGLDYEYMEQCVGLVEMLLPLFSAHPA
jgi:putative aminopeptidase FrvX